MALICHLRSGLSSFSRRLPHYGRHSERELNTLTTGESTLALDRQLTKRWDAFVEYVGDLSEQEARGICCISEPPTARGLNSRSMCMSAWAIRRHE